ncbi:hypothetical protein Trydic_g22351 [Trypoxylus dichotomus]
MLGMAAATFSKVTNVQRCRALKLHVLQLEHNRSGTKDNLVGTVDSECGVVVAEGDNPPFRINTITKRYSSITIKNNTGQKETMRKRARQRRRELPSSSSNAFVLNSNYVGIIVMLCLLVSFTTGKCLSISSLFTY